ncbi:HAD family hydrolase [Saccharospirillum impatiens]|uniref:histidinol-phosphatase n=1 Tax=Saccharospirillum impatiens TaxID=169438 RepID=UPI0004235385|nr:HAD family hydrolase [Saccharospirillum impatiens]
MTLAIFDLDNTLLAGDSDHAWGQFLIDQGLVDSAVVKAANEAFYKQYQAGELDIDRYLRFSLSFLANKPIEELASLHRHFMSAVIEPMIAPGALSLLDQHRQRGDTLMIITATNHFVTGPIARHLNIPHLIACEAEMNNGRYTGLPTGTPSYQQGKVVRLQSWLDAHRESLDGAWFYSDSLNDLPLLRLVDNPVAVDPDATLAAEAQRQNWPIISLRD